MEQRYEAPPHDCNGLFAVLMDRLDDLAYELAHDDFNIRKTLRKISEEDEIQNYLVGRIQDRSNGAYTVVREPEVADRKRPDFQLAATRGVQRAVVEVKIADNWNVLELERALRNQLVGQYLRDAACKAGCLLLTYHGAKAYWKHPISGVRLSFSEVVCHLNEIGQTIEVDQGYRVRLGAQGLDLTDPFLAPAHRPRRRAKSEPLARGGQKRSRGGGQSLGSS